MVRILLADDDRATRDLVRRALASDRLEVVVAQDGQEALERLEKEPSAFALLITDIEMPGLDGVELASRARAAEPRLKVVLISGHASGLERADALKGPLVRCVMKPFTLEQIRAEVRALLG